MESVGGKTRFFDEEEQFPAAGIFAAGIKGEDQSL